MNEASLSRTAVLWQLLTVVAVTLPHLTHLPFWVPVLVLFSLSFRFMVYSGRWSFPKWWVKGLLVLLAGGSILASYKAGGGISVTVALLIAGFGLKMLEINSRRDSTVVLYVAYIVLSTAFLFDHSIALAVYVNVGLVIITSALLSSHIDRNTRFLEPFLRCCYLFIPAIPLMLVMFIGMPRLQPMWEVGLDRAAKTGLANSMSPGDITSLTRSADVAFSARFAEGAPEQSQLYWRAIVLNDFDGRQWFNRETLNTPLQNNHSIDVSEGAFEYEMILEASQRDYVPVLDYLSTWPRGLSAKSDGTLLAPSPQTKRNQYQLMSSLDPGSSIKLHVNGFKRELELPDGNIEARQLAYRWWSEAGNYDDFIRKMRSFYHERFRYSLSPPPLGGDSISDFLLQTQIGFCGHFSSATAYMLRAVGIPARVVTGYQGGEWNPYEEYFLVRQYDAHAWVEAWHPERGWLRLDPTVWVAPERVELPADEILSRDNSFLKDSPFSALGITQNSVLSELRLRLEAFNYGWHRWVLNYHHQQKGVLERFLGAYSILRLALFFIVPFVLVIVLTVFFLSWPKRHVHLHPADKLIHRLSIGLSETGFYLRKAESSLALMQGETVSHYCERVSIIRPDLEVYLREINEVYVKHRYSQRGQADDIAQLAKAIKQCILVSRSRFGKKA